MTVVASGVEYGMRFRDAALEIDAVSHRVDGIIIDDFSLEVGRGNVAGIIGAGEAVKTAALKLITGQLRPATGNIRLAGRDITHALPEERAQMGLACCCQGNHCHGMKLFGDLSSLENVALGAYGNQTPFFPRHGGKSVEEQARSLLAYVGLSADPDRPADELPLPQKRLLSIAVALAGAPSVIIMDHAGCDMPFHDYMHLANLIERIQENGIAILLASCRYGPLLKLCDHISVLTSSEENVRVRLVKIASYQLPIEAPLGSLQ